MKSYEQHPGNGRKNGRNWLRVTIAVAIVISTIATGLSTTLPNAQAQESLVLEPVVGGLDAPVQVTNAGDGSNRLFVVERPGRLRIVVDGKLQETPFLDLTDRVHTDDSEQGLLSLAFHPDYENNGEFFVFYTADDWANTVERFVVSDDPNIANRDGGEIVLSIPDREPNHNGGSLVFGPDNMLYI
ncbi:MAG TPA: PQQ-dependent sugar dehydrogenase, partial [Thermomicrobiales bacterium]|nr:PQQ-dependent sugar dehydrogenase [Thermomicrobiales bacterium]